MHSYLLGGSPGTIQFGTTTTGLTSDETLLAVTSDLSRISHYYYTPVACFKDMVCRF